MRGLSFLRRLPFKESDVIQTELTCVELMISETKPYCEFGFPVFFFFLFFFINCAALTVTIFQAAINLDGPVP